LSSHDTDIDRQVFTGQVEFLYHQLRPSLIASLVVAGLIIATLWNKLPGQILLLWSTLLITVTALRYYLLTRFRQASPSADRMRQWRYYFILSTACAGFVWGMAGSLLMPPGSLDYQMLLIFIMGGLMAVSSQTLSATITPFVVFSTPIMLLTASWLFMQDNPLHHSMALLLIFFSFTLLFFTRYFHKTLAESLRLQFSNTALVKKLEQEALHREHTSSIVLGQNSILEMLAKQQPLDALLSEINRMVEMKLPNALSSLLILDHSRQHLLTVSAPTLPKAYCQAIGKIPVGPEKGSCGSAAYRNKMVIVEDIASDPLWSDYKDIALDHGLRACWSIPITDSHETVLGTFALYYRERKKPNAEEIETLRTTANLAGIAIEHKRSEEELRRLAHVDILTSLPNRALFMDRLEQAIAQSRRQKKQFALLFIDLDRFKIINDTLGHEAGDKVLIEVARRLERCVRQMDTIARFGGDEFIILLTDIGNPRDVVSVADKVLESLSLIFNLDGGEYLVGGSIGISMYPGDGTDVDTLIKNADAAMYRTKNNGSAGYQFYTLNVSSEAKERADLENSLSRAIDESELLLYYQPVIDLCNGNIASLESLIRWQHPDKGLLSAGDFIQIAEESHLILPLDEYVLRMACQQHTVWNETELAPFPLSVNLTINISAMQLKNRNLPMIIQEILRDTDIRPGQLGIELTEDVTNEFQKETIDMLTELKSIGVQVIVDDFGTGVSSINYLKDFPIDAIKIDRSIINNLPGSQKFTMAIIDIAHSMDIRTIAEGVETGKELDLVSALGFDEAQGFLFSRPLSAEKMSVFLKTYRSKPVITKEI